MGKSIFNIIILVILLILGVQALSQTEIKELERNIESASMDLFKLKMKEQMERESGSGSLARAEEYFRRRKSLVRDKINEFGINQYISDFETISKNEGSGSPKIFKKYGQILNALKDFYFEYSQMLIDEADDEIAQQISQ